MGKISLDKIAPDFILQDWQGNPVQLAQFRGERQVVIVFNRGFS